jgi:large conductance mechanosensitive channel
MARKIATKHASGFITFVREQGVIGLAVGLAIGTAAGASVKVIVDELISPIVALLTRGVDLNSLKWVILEKSKDQPEVAIGYGAILSSIITLLATAFVIYQVVHIAKLDRADKKKD